VIYAMMSPHAVADLDYLLEQGLGEYIDFSPYDRVPFLPERPDRLARSTSWAQTY